MKRHEAEHLIEGVERGLSIIVAQEQRQVTIDLFIVLTAVLASIADVVRENGHHDLFAQVEGHVNTLAELLHVSCFDDGEDPAG